MIKSMTGFGRGRYQTEKCDAIVEIKTVNHRYCDVFVKMPRYLNFLEDKIREKVSKGVSRGKVEVWISYEEFLDDSREVFVDEILAKKYVSAVQGIKESFNLKDDITVSLISRFPDIIRVQKSEQDEDTIWGHIDKAITEALSSLVSMREKEGGALVESILEKANIIENIVKEIELRAPTVPIEYKARLENKMKELIEKELLDENRIAVEVAMFADRCSIDEELVRLDSHIEQLRNILKKGDSVGRKLDFLLQEMNREINTIGSKSNDLQITRNVVDVKSEIEKIREQIQNIE